MGILADVGRVLWDWFLKNRNRIVRFVGQNPLLSSVALLTTINSALIIQYYYPLVPWAPLNPSASTSWPDAVMCQWNEPGTGQGSPTRLVFILSALDAGRVGGNKVIYTLAGNGGFDYDNKHFYVPHFLWFRQIERTLVKPEDLGILQPLSHEYFYKQGFLDKSKNGGIGDIDCGGGKIDEIVSRGGGLFFARKLH